MLVGAECWAHWTFPEMGRAPPDNPPSSCPELGGAELAWLGRWALLGNAGQGQGSLSRAGRGGCCLSFLLLFPLFLFSHSRLCGLGFSTVYMATPSLAGCAPPAQTGAALGCNSVFPEEKVLDQVWAPGRMSCTRRLDRWEPAGCQADPCGRVYHLAGTVISASWATVSMGQHLQGPQPRLTVQPRC